MFDSNKTLGIWPYVPLVVLFTIILGADLVLAAQDPADPMQSKIFPTAHIFTYLFLMLGPFKILGPLAGAAAIYTQPAGPFAIVSKIYLRMLSLLFYLP